MYLMDIIKIEQVRRPLKKGERFMVPCVLYRSDEFDEYSKINAEIGMERELYFIPVIPILHSDVENGQPESHYHYDERFNIKRYGIMKYNKLPLGLFELRPEPNDRGLRYIEMKVARDIGEYNTSTSSSFITKSKLNVKCISKGKCPHKGYDLSQVKPVNGIVTCPLHNLKIDIKNKTIINNIN